MPQFADRICDVVRLDVLDGSGNESIRRAALLRGQVSLICSADAIHVSLRSVEQILKACQFLKVEAERDWAKLSSAIGLYTLIVLTV